MPLYAARDRSIWIGLEQPAGKGIQGTNAVLAYANQAFIQQFLPVNDLLTAVAIINGIVNNGAVNTALQGLGPISLAGPTSIDIDYDAKIGDDSGIATNFTQPWFIKNVPVRIKGTSYLGAYEGVSRGDDDAAQILKMYRTSLNDFAQGINGAPGTGQRFLIQLTGMPAGMDRFVGYIRNFHITENIESVYLLDYSLDFLGKCMDNANVMTGTSNAKIAAAAFGIQL